MKHKRTAFWSNNKAVKRAIIPTGVRQRLLNAAKPKNAQR